MKRNFAFIFFIFSLYGLSCSPKKECIDPFILLTFTGYKLNEIDTFVIKKFKKNTEFETLLDTTVADMNKWGYYFHDDTTEFSMLGYPQNITASYDWEISVPSNGSFYRIHGIRAEKIVKRDWEAASKKQCYNHILNLFVNKRLYNFYLAKDDQKDYKVFLPK